MQGTNELQKLRRLREVDKKTLQTHIEQSDRAIKDHNQRMEELQKVKDEVAQNILTWDNLISMLEGRRES